ncbi:hypothetical protein JKP88DRAFT_88987 [Tribonema minus]|uniref:RING-type E3 ubiquitin transferase n=1 Tax=Tribonema minus TaxID=303371 RepID=A0A836C9F1_9STRA|nr:hypothetical protein JKP88DRAFT_88987 [Tribonema minus]
MSSPSPEGLACIGRTFTSAGGSAPGTPEPAPKSARSSGETEEERVMRELQESEALARELMESEALASYQAGMDALRAAQGMGGWDEGMGEADIRAMRLAMGEEQEDDGGMGEGEEEEGDEETPMEYDALLELGEAIGDVKQERWRLRAPAAIARLPRKRAAARSPGAAAAAACITDAKCLVCMCEYEAGEELMALPCGHDYHASCVAAWLARADACPLCKRSVCG